MIGSDFEELAQEYGMNVDRGVAYGSLGGYCATLFETSGFKQITFSTTIGDAAKLTQLQTALSKRDLKKEFRVAKLEISATGILVIFSGNFGALQKIKAFLEYFLPLLREAEATGVDICPVCGCEITDGCWKLISGTARHLHQACADKICRMNDEISERRKQEDRGNYFTGFLGALLGSAVGAVLWAVVLYFGYVASLVGFVIGWLAEKGYNLLKGKQGKGKIVILVIAVIIGVLLGNFGADAITLVQMINAGEMGAMTYGEIPALILLVLLEDAEYLTGTLSNIGMGLLFAALGVWSLLRRAKAEVSDTKIVDLK